MPCSLHLRSAETAHSIVKLCQDLKLKAWRLALAQLSAPEGPVELDGSERLRVRPSCGRSELDLTEVPAFCTENHRQAGRDPQMRRPCCRTRRAVQEPSSPSRDARAPIIDAALVRILKPLIRKAMGSCFRPWRCRVPSDCRLCRAGLVMSYRPTKSWRSSRHTPKASLCPRLCIGT